MSLALMSYKTDIRWKGFVLGTKFPS